MFGFFFFSFFCTSFSLFIFFLSTDCALCSGCGCKAFKYKVKRKKKQKVVSGSGWRFKSLPEYWGWVTLRVMIYYVMPFIPHSEKKSTNNGWAFVLIFRHSPSITLPPVALPSQSKIVIYVWHYLNKYKSGFYGTNGWYGKHRHGICHRISTSFHFLSFFAYFVAHLLVLQKTKAPRKYWIRMYGYHLLYSTFAIWTWCKRIISYPIPFSSGIPTEILTVLDDTCCTQFNGAVFYLHHFVNG